MGGKAVRIHEKPGNHKVTQSKRHAHLMAEITPACNIRKASDGERLLDRDAAHSHRPAMFIGHRIMR